MLNIEKMREMRASYMGSALKILDGVKQRGGDLKPAEAKDFDGLVVKIESLDAAITKEQAVWDLQAEDAFRAIGRTSGSSRRSDGGLLILGPKDSLTRFGNEQNDEELNLGRYLRGIVTGNWDGAAAELRNMSEGTLGDGGHLVPSPLSTSIIDKARAQAVIIQAGALTIPMGSQTLKMARLTGDPTIGWKAENAAANLGDLVFDSVTFSAKTLMGVVKLSEELFEDAPNVDAVVSNALAQSLALELDRVGLRGSGTDPEPRGVRNASGIQTIDMGTNGLAFTDFSKVSTASRMVRDYNFTPSALVMAPRTWGVLDGLKDTTNQPLRPPASYEELMRLVTSQVPVGLTKGSSSVASECYVGDFKQLAIGMRTQLVLQVSRQAADASSSAFRNLQVWVRCYLRADIQVMQPKAFVLIDGVL